MCGRGSGTDNTASSGHILCIPQDVESYNHLPFPVVFNDYTPEHKHIVWGNSEFVQILGMNSVTEISGLSINKASEGMKRLHQEYYESVQVNHQTHGPTRRQLFSPSKGAHTVDMTVVPVRALCPGSDEPRMLAMCCMVPAPAETTSNETCSHFMIERVSSMAMLFSHDGALIQQNSLARSHFRTLSGRADGSVTLREVLESYVFEDDLELESTLSKIQELELGNGAIIFERAVRCADGNTNETSRSESWHKMRFEASLDPSSRDVERSAIMVCGQDVSDLRRTQSDLLSIHDQNQQVFAGLAHQLRTPLHSILNLSDSLMDDKAFPMSLHKTLSAIQSEGKRMSDTISDVVDAAPRQFRSSLIKHSDVALHEVAQSVCTTVSCTARRGVQIVNQVPKDLPTIQGEYCRLFQVLMCLVDNSLRFTSWGFVRVGGRRVLSGSVPSVEVWVSDTGSGIAADKLDELFSAHHSAVGTDGKKSGKRGLGLALVKTLVEGHQGSVRLESSCSGKKHGTTVTVTLPIHQPNASQYHPGIECLRPLCQRPLTAERRTSLPLTHRSLSSTSTRSQRSHSFASWSASASSPFPPAPPRVPSSPLIAPGPPPTPPLEGAPSSRPMDDVWADRFRVLDLVSLPCWIADLQEAEGPMIVWSNTVAAALWGREQAEMKGLSALAGPLAQGGELTEETYRGLQHESVKVVRQQCNFVEGRQGMVDIMLRCFRGVDWQSGAEFSGAGADGERRWVLHVGLR